MDLKNKKIIVTGGANGIGKSIVENLLEEGGIVGVLDIDEKGLNDLKSEYRVYTQLCDVSDPQDVKKAIEIFHGDFKEINVLINNAGIIYNAPLLRMDTKGLVRHEENMWEKVIKVNLSSVFFMMLYVSERMVLDRTEGVIVNIGSVCSHGNAGQAAYSAAKAGVNALTVVGSKELSPFGIRVACVSPGFTKTGSMQSSMTDKVKEEWRKKTPLRKFADPEEIAQAVLFIIKDDFFNGRILEIDGGLRI